MKTINLTITFTSDESIN